MMSNSSVRQLAGLVQHLERRVDLADVVHQRGEPELAQQRAVQVERARLRHRQRRDVHHVRERVVVVLLQRGQRHQRRAVLGHQPCEAVDDLPRGAGIGLFAGLGRLPQRFGRLHRRRVDPLGGDDAGLLVGDLLDRPPVRGRCCGRRAPPAGRAAAPSTSGRRGRRRSCVSSSRVRPRLSVIFSISRSRRSRAKPTSAAVPRGSRDAVDDDLVVDEADDDAVRVLQRLLRRGDEVVDAALHQRMVGRVQIRAAHRGGDSADEIFCPGLIHQRP